VALFIARQPTNVQNNQDLHFLTFFGVTSFVLVDGLRLGLELVEFLAGAVFVDFLAAGLAFLEDTSGLLDFFAADVLLTPAFFLGAFFADSRPLAFAY
jgi:hypothetical protein